MYLVGRKIQIRGRNITHTHTKKKGGWVKRKKNEKRYILNPCGSTFQRTEVVRSVNRDSNKRVIVLIIKQTPNDFIMTHIQKTYPLVCLCSQKNKKKQAQIIIMLKIKGAKSLGFSRVNENPINGNCNTKNQI